MILFINACIREHSRTKYLAEILLSKLGYTYEEVDLGTLDFPVIDETYLQKREQLIQEGKVTDPILSAARQFAEAELIVIAAPYWDLSFPAILKRYLEQINVVGITFRYTPDGLPEGLCRAKKLYYVQTAGGEYVPEIFGYGYVRALAQTFYGIPETELIQAVGLDIRGADTDKILNECACGILSAEERT